MSEPAVTQDTDPVYGLAYLLVNGTHAAVAVHRTVEVAEGLLVDLDEQGKVLGIESLNGPIGFGALFAIVRAIPLPPAGADGRVVQP